MRVVFISLSVVALLSFSQTARSQNSICADQYDQHMIMCQVNQCHEWVTQGIPKRSTQFVNGWWFNKSSILCCGIAITSYDSTGGQCYGSELKSPETQAVLALLAAKEDLLVADYGNNYRLF